MRAIAIALFTLLLGAGPLSPDGAQGATTQGYSSEPVRTVTRMPPGAIQLAGSYQRSSAKSGDKYLAGRAGGRYGVGGSESRIFRKK